MSKTITLIAAGAPPALVQAASSILSAATSGSVKATQAASASSAAVVLGSHPPQGVIAAVVRPPANPEPAYKGVKTTVVRAVLPRAAQDKLQLRDALDVYPAAGIDGSREAQAAEAAYAQAATLAAKIAKEDSGRAARVTLVIKPATKYQRLNELFTKSATKAVEAAGLSCDVVHTAKAANDLVMFPEKYGVVLTNDEPVGENVQLAYAAALGGAPVTYHTASGSHISGGSSYKTVALAIAQELRGLGMAAEAGKIEAAAQKDPRNVAKAL